MNVPSKGGIYEVNVSTTGERWSVTTEAGEWVTLASDGNSTSSGKITIKVATNEGNARSASVVVASEKITEKIAIEQEAVFKLTS